LAAFIACVHYLQRIPGHTAHTEPAEPGLTKGAFYEKVAGGLFGGGFGGVRGC